jgi:hypothetical protein
MLGTQTVHLEAENLHPAPDFATEALPQNHIQARDLARQQWREELALVEADFQA